MKDGQESKWWNAAATCAYAKNKIWVKAESI